MDTVVGLDVDAAKVEKLSLGISPFYEPEFDELLRRNVEAGRLTFSTDYTDTVNAQPHLIGVGIPTRENGGGSDLRYVDAATGALLEVLPMNPSNTILVAGKSNSARRHHGLFT